MRRHNQHAHGSTVFSLPEDYELQACCLNALAPRLGNEDNEDCVPRPRELSR